jgi:hypothetical protein
LFEKSIAMPDGELKPLTKVVADPEGVIFRRRPLDDSVANILPAESTATPAVLTPVARVDVVPVGVTFLIALLAKSETKRFPDESVAMP